MKYFKTLTIICLLASLLIGCFKNDILDIAGEYKFDGIKYLSGLSSASKDFKEEKEKGDIYHISSTGIKITSTSNAYEYSDIIFQKEQLKDDVIYAFGDFDTISLDEYHEKYQYNIYDKENNLLNIRLYLLDNELWFSHFRNNTKDKSEMIFDIIKLVKQK